MRHYDDSKVESATDVDHYEKLYELTAKMKLHSREVKLGYETNNVVKVTDNSQKLADTVIEFLKVAGWSRS